jgi:tetratricopeptide (TPR) repeat protein
LKSVLRGEWTLPGGASSFGPSAAIEFMPIKNRLEIELGVSPMFSRGRTEYDTELVFKTPLLLGLPDNVEVMFGGGPAWLPWRDRGRALFDSIAKRIDPAFAEAWYNLGDLLDDPRRSETAIECYRKALQVAPDYVDAMFNLALLLQRRNRKRRGGRLLASLSRYRRPIGMGYPRTPITEIL